MRKVVVCLIIIMLILVGCTSKTTVSTPDVIVPTPTPTPTPAPVIVEPVVPVSTPAPIIVDPTIDLIKPDPKESNIIIGDILEDTPQDELAMQIFDLVNNERVKYGVPKLMYDYRLQTAANIRAREINKNFSHTRPDGSDYYTIVKNFDYNTTGENLLKTSSNADAEVIVNAWMNSPGHRDNIRFTDYTTSAVGVYIENNEIYCVQIFMG